MNYEELVKSKKNIGDMTKEELFEYCSGLLEEVWDFEKEIERLHSIIKEVREYIEKCQLGVDSRDRPVMLKYLEEGRRLLEILDKENIE